MSKIEETLNQIIVSESDKNRSIEDLFMDVIGCLVDANRNRDDRSKIKMRPESRNYYEWTIRETFEDSLACVVIKLLEIAKTKDVLPIDTDSQNYYKYHWVGKSTPEFIYDIIEVFYDSSSRENFTKISIAIKRIEILSELLKIDLWHHVELRLKYNQGK